MIHEEQARLNCQYETNPQVIKDYHKNLAEIESLDNEITKFTKELESMQVMAVTWADNFRLRLTPYTSLDYPAVCGVIAWSIIHFLILMTLDNGLNCRPVHQLSWTPQLWGRSSKDWRRSLAYRPYLPHRLKSTLCLEDGWYHWNNCWNVLMNNTSSSSGAWVVLDRYVEEHSERPPASKCLKT